MAIIITMSVESIVNSNEFVRMSIRIPVLASGVVEVTFLIDHTVSGNITVTGVELYDHNGQRIGSKTVSITRADATEGILYVCRFSLFQVKENTSNTGAYDAL